MMMSIDNYEIIEFIDLLDYTFSDKFVSKWRHRFSTSFIKKFQYKLLKTVSDKKPLKKRSLYHYMTKKCKYSEEQVQDFFQAIEIEIYYPMIL
jgi:hypothetical protein